MRAPKEFKLALVDDHNLFRKGLIKLIHLADTDNKYTILFEAENGVDMTHKLDITNMPDIILMDIDMPDMDGYESVEWLKRNHPGIRVLVISMFEKEEAILRMLGMGVKGILSKDIEVEDMHLALEAIGNKGTYFSENAMQVIMDTGRRDRETPGDDPHTLPAPVGKPLTQVEHEFLALVCTKMTYNEIAEKMFLSPKTIDGYREAMFKRFKVTTRVTLAIYAIKHGYVSI